MSERKYLDLAGLTHYDSKIKEVIDTEKQRALSAENTLNTDLNDTKEKAYNVSYNESEEILVLIPVKDKN